MAVILCHHYLELSPGLHSLSNAGGVLSWANALPSSAVGLFMTLLDLAGVVLASFRTMNRKMQFRVIKDEWGCVV